MIANPTAIQRADSTNSAQPNYSQHFSDTSFWRKIGRAARFAGREVTEKALFLYFALGDPNMPKWAKGVVYGALGYFIFPADAVPDVIPGVGFTDDLGALAAALAVVIAHITPEVKAKARQQMHAWFDAGEAAYRYGNGEATAPPH